MSNSDSDNNNNNVDFGSILSESRKFQKYTIDDVSRHLKIPVPMLEAIEANDIASLPPPTFTKGYLRAYARYLEIPEQKVLDIYNQAVPHNRVAKLKSRSNLPSEKNSQTPLIKMVTVFLVIAGVAALIYGMFDYYQEKANVMESELESKEAGVIGSSLDSPVPEKITIEQDARLTADDELVLNPSETAEQDTIITDNDEQPDSELQQTTGAAEFVPVSEAGEDADAGAEPAAAQDESELAAVEPRDTIEFIAEKGSWMEIRDATGTRLFYNMVPVGGSKTLHGVAPFTVSLGNARTTKVVINGLEVDMLDFIRANNTAKFSVSSDQESVVFH